MEDYFRKEQRVADYRKEWILGFHETGRDNRTFCKRTYVNILDEIGDEVRTGGDVDLKM